MMKIRWLAIYLFVFLSGCRDTDDERTAESPESSRSVLRLDAEDQKRLGIVLVPARRETLEVTKSAVGWLETPPASQTVVRSPVNGFIVAKSGGDWPLLGQEIIGSHTELAHVNVFLTPQEVTQLVMAKEDNDVQMQQALVTMELSESQLKQVTDAREAVAGTRIAQLQEALAHSKTAYQEARDKLPFLIQEPYEDGLLVKPISVESSVTGRVTQIHFAPGQFVISGDPLWTIADWSTLWIRVPVFEQDASRIDRTANAMVLDPATGKRTFVIAINAAIETKPLTRTVDFLFAIENADWRLRVGQSVIVEIPVIGHRERNGASHRSRDGGELSETPAASAVPLTTTGRDAILIPRSALLYNEFGQASCFVVNNANEFTRKRVELGDRRDEYVEITRGIEADDKVVAIGGQQLAADESKADLAVEDDD